MKESSAVRRETLRVAGGMLVLSLFMEACWWLLGWWKITVLLGNVLGGVIGVLNFFLMGKMAQQVRGKKPEEAEGMIRKSLRLRNLMQLAALMAAGIVPLFDVFATILAILFPKIIVTRYATRGQEKKKKEKKKKIGL